MKYFLSEPSEGKHIWHICSPESLISIIDSGEFISTFSGDYGYDSGLNCYSDEVKGIWNYVQGEGAVLHLSWLGLYGEAKDSLKTPYPKNRLLIFRGWRAFVPIRSDAYLLRITGFEIKDFSKLDEVFKNRHPLIRFLPFIQHLAKMIWLHRLKTRLAIKVRNSNRLFIR
ncbi:MAG TPA: hypothetical protein VKY45_08155 [Marinilabiliaceae bacterium]|nr:hypothetical protein [Marinilabiliaceae bacterium]